jgi:hypothetical protein
MSRRRNPRLKKAHKEIEYTQADIQELVRCAKDPKYFIKNYIRIKHPKKGKISFDLYDYQEDMVDLYHRERFSILMSARQTGKTETICAYLLWYAIFNEDVTIMVVSNKSDNAKEIIGKIQYAYEELPDWLKPGIDEDSWNKHECKFDNASRIISTTTSEDSGRGYAISLLYCDEFAFVKNSIQEKFWTSILPTISTGGDCIISSTPNGNSNLFAELWKGAQNGINEFKAMHIPWYAPPGRNEEFKKQQIGALGKRKWLQEYECRFLSSDITLIDSFVLNQIENEMDKRFEEHDGEPPVAFKIGDLEFFKKINKSLAYIVSVDVASGNGNDYSVIEVTEFPTMEQVLEFRSNNTNEKFLYSRLKNILLFLQQNSSEVYFSVENNGLGASILALYEYDENPPESSMLVSDNNSKRLGLSMSENTKRGACMKLKHMIENRNYKFHSRQLLREFKGYTRQGATFKAETGATDDCIAALLILMRILEEMADHNPYAYDQLYNIKGQDDKQKEWDDEFTDDPTSIDDMALPIIFS